MVIRQDPIFIVGYPRSGTTLLQALLSTQSNIYSFPETHFFTRIVSNILNKNDELDKKNKSLILQNIKDVLGITYPNEQTQEILNKSITIKGMFEIVIAYYLGELVTPETIEHVRWLEKTPGHILHLEQLQNYYPLASFIQIIRDPIPAIYSRKRYFQRDKTGSVARLANDWENVVTSFESFQTHSPQKGAIVKYEDLVRNPTKELERLCTIINIEIDEQQIGQYKDKAEFIVLPSEEWKSGVITDNMQNTNSKYSPSQTDLFIIQHILKSKMNSYGYSIRNPYLQVIYDGTRNLVFLILKTLSKIKRFILSINKSRQ